MVIKLLKRIAFLILPVLIIMATVNYIVDPALVLHDGKFESEIAQAILNNKDVSLTTNYNERKVQRFIIQGITESPDGIIVGSSRVMKIPLTSLGIENGFCNGVSGATIEDIISIIGMYDNRNMLPSKVVIGIDPWLFNDNHSDTRYHELIREYNAFADKLNLSPLTETIESKPWFIKISQALSPTYFQASIDAIQNAPAHPTVIAKEKNLETTEIKDSLTTEAEIDEVNKSVLAIINTNFKYQSENYKELSQRVISNLEMLVDYLESEGVFVTFILPPVHPLYYEYITNTPECKMLIEAETFIYAFAEEKKIEIIGSYNPELVGADNADFTDYIHPTWEVMAKICS